jgi:hypothetical protein
MDLEPVSQYNPSTEPRGQEIRLGRPVADTVQTALDSLPGSLLGTVDISGGATIVVATNDVLRGRTASGDAFVDATIAAAAYGSGQALVDAINAALDTAGLAITAGLDATGTFLTLQSDSTGYIEIDSEGNGSTSNSDIGIAAGGDSFTVPGAAAVITALSPVGGPLDVTDATVAATLGEGLTQAQENTVMDLIAPRFIETDVAIKSAQVGMIAGFASASYNPDPNRLPAIVAGAAIEVVNDDGTAFSAPLTVVSSATADSPNAGDLTIAGTNLGDIETVEATVVKVVSADGKTSVKVYGSVIASTVSGGTTGSVTATSIVIPASLLNGLGVVDSTVQVQFTSFASDVETVV